MGCDDNNLGEVAVYPNAATKVINVAEPSNLELRNTVLFDGLEKHTGAALVLALLMFRI